MKVLIVKNVAQAEEFLRQSQRELHLALNDLQSEYVATVRKLAESAKEKRFQALRDSIMHLKPPFLSEMQDTIVGRCLIKQLYVIISHRFILRRS